VPVNYKERGLQEMPFIGSKVTVKILAEKEEIIKKKLGEAIELIPGKNETFLMIGFEDEYSLYLGGEKLEKGAFIEVKIFGKASKDSYAKLTAAICKIYEEELGIPPNKIYVKYEEIENWGWNGSNF
jgi:phenylpyruvate tautomerase PptA (4-oxalocrotonate tautomerase family)